MLPIGSRRPLRAGAPLLVALVAWGCSGERQFTPEGFIEEMNANGAALQLGPVLTTSPEGGEIRSVTFTEVAPSATGEGSSKAKPPGEASLVVADDTNAAQAEFARCEAAADLTCFRASNAVLRAAELDSSDQARITTALESLQQEGE